MSDIIWLLLLLKRVLLVVSKEDTGKDMSVFWAKASTSFSCNIFLAAVAHAHLTCINNL